MTFARPSRMYLLLVTAQLLGATGSAQQKGMTARGASSVPRIGTASIKGQVVDGETGAALARAYVRLMGAAGERPTVVTDASGEYAFTSLPPGGYTIGVDKVSYLAGGYPNQGLTLRTGHRPLLLRDGQ